MRARLKSERGTALLETAVTLPLVLLASVAMFEFGRAYQTWQVLTNAAREGARIAVLPGTTDTDIDTRVKAYLSSGQLPNAATATVAIDRTKTVSIGLGTAPATQVTVNYPFSFMVLNPVAKLVTKNSTLGGSSMTMSTSAEMRNE
jgi:Flp pilus assembly protein TadG